MSWVLNLSINVQQKAVARKLTRQLPPNFVLSRRHCRHHGFRALPPIQYFLDLSMIWFTVTCIDNCNFQILQLKQSKSCQLNCSSCWITAQWKEILYGLLKESPLLDRIILTTTRTEHHGLRMSSPLMAMRN